jgi:hypothetical protein
MPSLRGQLRPREGAGQLPVLLLDLGPLPYQLPATGQEHVPPNKRGGARKGDTLCR